MSDCDVIVVGAGNAAMAAALSAREQGARRVVVLEKATEARRGGNTHYGGGLFRFAYDRAEDLRPLAPDVEHQFDQKVTPLLEGRYKTGHPAVGGLFHINCPGGSGLMSGAVFGRIAGANAAGE